jgi:alpha-1,2-mannosyltransferase
VSTRVPAGRTRPRSGAREFLLASAIAAAVAIPWVGWRLRNLGVPIDFAVYRAGGLHIVQGIDLYVRQSSNMAITGFGRSYLLHSTFSYPPFSALTFVPLAAVPAWVGALLWELGSLTALVALVGISFRRLLDRARHRSLAWGAISAVAIVTTPVTDTLFFGQINLFIVLLIVADWTGTERWRGVRTGVAAAMKLTPLLFFVLFLVTKQWRAAIRATATFAAAAALAWIVLPGASWAYWTDPSLALRRVGGIETSANQSLHGMFATLGLPMWWLPVAIVGVAAAGLVAARRRYLAGDGLAAVCCVGLVTLLVSPVSWVHHGVWIVPVIGVVVGDGRRTARVWVAIAATVLFILRLPLLGSVLLRNGGWSGIGRPLEAAFVLADLALLAIVGSGDSGGGAPVAPTARAGSRGPDRAGILE